jgi:hypothetical protein
MSTAYLVLPLRRHDLCVGSADVDASIQAGLVVNISNVTTHGAASAGRAVVGTLGGEGGGSVMTVGHRIMRDSMGGPICQVDMTYVLRKADQHQ